ncbi:MAG: hypothetical protein FJW34_23925 [Acidobacteria bacterium]|nr:hypothetical protein [Acidobacteriota bacterium]
MEHLTAGMMIADRELRARLMRALAGLPIRVVMELPGIGSAEEAFIESEVMRSDPDVVFLEIVALGDRFLEVIRLLKGREFPPAVVCMYPEAHADILLTAMRAGADDCLYPPFEEEVMREALDRIAVEHRRARSRRPLARTVGFLSPTGGCGGTTLACHFASELHRISGQKMLLADFDLAAGMVGFWMRAGNGYSIWDAVRGLQRLDSSLWRGLVSSAGPQLDVVTAPVEIMTDGGGEAERLAKVLRFARHHYDWVAADLGSGLSAATLRLVGELGAIMVVACAEVPVLYQTRRVLQKLVSLGYPQRRIRLVLNRHHRQRQVRADEVKQALGWDIEAILPSDLVETEQALAEQRLISPRCELGKRIVQLATRFAAEQLEEPEELPRPVSISAAPVKALQRVRYGDAGAGG